MKFFLFCIILQGIHSFLNQLYSEFRNPFNEIHNNIKLNELNLLALMISSCNLVTTTSVTPVKQQESVITGLKEGAQRQPVKSSSLSERERFGSSFIRDAVRNVGSSVVRIDCERDVPYIANLFVPEGSQKEAEVMKVSGSGFVFTVDGYLLTNAHVVNQARKITVTLSSGRTFRANMVACDEFTDLAVLKADTDGIKLKPAPLGDSSKLHSGDWLIAVGCPVGLDFTVTLGDFLKLFRLFTKLT
jgi:S1-C subfamily serine protease